MMVCGIDIEQDYYHWLCEYVGIQDKGAGYCILAHDLHKKPFYVLVEHDRNRAMDGLDLREEYLEDVNYPKYAHFDEECSVLEMLIGLARRISYETGRMDEALDTTKDWFWEMISNLGLAKFDDEHYVDLDGFYKVDEILDIFLQRDYLRDGTGGLFPLKNATGDQRNVEIWYQMNAYLMEKEG